MATIIIMCFKWKTQQLRLLQQYVYLSKINL